MLLKPRYLPKIQCCWTDAGVNDQDATRQLPTVPEITLNQALPRPLQRLRSLSITITRQIYKEKSLVNPKKIDRLGPARRRAGSGQSFLPEKAVDETRFSYVRPAHKSEFRKALLRELTGAAGAADEFSCKNLQCVTDSGE